jgi:hypothetical protein
MNKTREHTQSYSDIRQVKMSVRIHEIGNSLSSTQNPSGTGKGERSFLVDLSGFTGVTGTPSFPLGPESEGFTVGPNGCAGTLLHVVDTLSPYPYTLSPDFVWALDNPASATSVKSISCYDPNTLIPGGGGNLYGDNALHPKATVNAVNFNVGTPTQLIITTAVNGTGGLTTNADTFFADDNVLGLHSYTLFFGFIQTVSNFVLSSPNASKMFELINDPTQASQLARAFTQLGPDLKPGGPEEFEGGYVYRIVARAASYYTGLKDTLSSDVIKVEMYRLDLKDPTDQYWLYPATLTPLASISTHPLATNSTTNGDGLLLQQPSSSNAFLIPYFMNIKQLFELTGFTSISSKITGVAPTTEYFFKKPKYTLTSDWTNNAVDLGPTTTQVGSLHGPINLFFPFNQVAVEYATTVTNIVDDITTNCPVFEFFSYNFNLLTVIINGVQVYSGTSITPPPFLPDSALSIGNLGSQVTLTTPLNNVEVSFIDPFNKDRTVTSKFVIRYFCDGNAPSNNLYFWNGVYMNEIATAPASVADILVSYVDPTATSTNYTDAYGIYITGVGSSGSITGSVVSAAYPQAITVEPNSITYFGIVQNYWQAPSGSNPVNVAPAGIEFSSDGYIRAVGATVGTYLFYPSTMKGQITLTVTVANAPTGPVVTLPTQYTFYTFSNTTVGGNPGPIDLGLFGLTVPDTPSPTPSVPPYVAGNILYPTNSTSTFAAGGYSFVINVLATPASYPLNLKVRRNQKYDLSALLGFNSNIDPNILVGVGETADNGAPSNAFSWGTVGSGTAPTYAIYPGYYDKITHVNYYWGTSPLANITVVDLNYPSPPTPMATIVTRVGDKFYLNQYIQPHHSDTVLLSVDDGTGSSTAASSVSSQSDGQVTINSSAVTGITANMLILGVQVSLFFKVYLLQADSTVCFMTRGFIYFIPSGAIDITTSSNQIVSLTSGGTNTYTGDDITVSYVSSFVNALPGDGIHTIQATASQGFLLSKLLKPIIVKTQTTSPVCYDLIPFQTLPTSPITAVLDQNDNITIDLPSQPLYTINTTSTTSFFGGTLTFAPGVGVSDLTITLAEYNDLQQTIPLQIVKGTRKNLFIVNQNTITPTGSNTLSIVSSVPSFVTTVPANSTTGLSSIIVNRSSGASASDTMIVKESSTGPYVEYVFTFLPKVDADQTLLFTTGETYQAVLPSYGYDYTGSLIPVDTNGNLVMSTVIPNHITITGMYGEVPITFNLKLFNSAHTQLVSIYTSVGIGGTNNPNITPTQPTAPNTILSGIVSFVYAVDVNATNMVSPKSVGFPYQGSGFSFSAPDSNGIVTVSKDSPDIQVGQWFFEIAGENILVQFKNVPAPPNHPDIFIFDATTATLANPNAVPPVVAASGISTWTADVDFTVGSGTGLTVFKASGSQSTNFYASSYGPTSPSTPVFQFGTGDVRATASVSYYGTTYTFQITLESESLVPVYVCQKATHVISDQIVSYALDPTSFTTYSGSARLKTTNATILFSGQTLTIRNDKPNDTANETSTIYIKTTNGTNQANSLYEITTYPVPYAQGSIVLVEVYDNDPSVTPGNPPSLNLTFIPTFVNPPGYNNGMAPSESTITAVGTPTTLAYNFFDYQGTFTAIASIIKLPTCDVDDFQIVPYNVPYSFNFITQYFGSNSSYYRLDGVTSSNVSTPSGPVDLPTITYHATGEVTVTAPTSAVTGGELYRLEFTVSANPSRIPTIEATLSAVPKNKKVSDVLIYGYITFQSYDPDAVPQYVLTNAAGASTPQTWNPFPAGDKLNYVEYQGARLTGSSNQGLNWVDFPTISLQSAEQIVNDYFFFTTKSIVRLTTVCLLSAPTAQTLNLVPPPNTTTIDLFQMFFPTLRAQLIDAGLSTATIGANVYDYPSYSIGPFTNSQPLSVPFYIAETSPSQESNAGIISTMNININIVSNPVVPPSLTFVIPIGVTTNITSDQVSAGNTLTYDPSVPPPANVSMANAIAPKEGIEVTISVPGSYPLDVLLTAAGTNTITAIITFVAYDPALAIDNTVTSYSGAVQQTFSSAITQYSVDGAIISGSASSPFLTLNNANVNAPVVTMRGNLANPNHVFIFTLKTPVVDPLDSGSKNIEIYNFSYVPIQPATKTFYVAKGVTGALSLTAQMISNSSPTATIKFDTTLNSSVPDVNGAPAYDDAGVIVGYVNPHDSAMSALTLTANEPGTWANFVATVIDTDTIQDVTLPASTVGAPSKTNIAVTIETLGSLVLTTLPIFIFTLGQGFDIDLNDYIVNKIPVTFTNWMVAIGSAAPVTLPGSIFDLDKKSVGVISAASGAVTTAGQYVFTGTVTSQHHAALTTPFTITAIFYDPSSTTPLPLTIVGLQPSSTTLSGQIASIDGTPISQTAATYKDGNVQFGFGLSGQLIVQALTTLTTEQVYNLVLTDGSNILLTVIQVGSAKDTIVDSTTASGNIFGLTTGLTVVNYVISGTSTPTYNTGTQYGLPNQGLIYINTDGTYNITSPTAVSFVVSYTGASTGTLNLIVQGYAANTVSVEQPSYTLPIPDTTLSVTVNGYSLTKGKQYGLSYGSFTWNTNSLVVGVSSTFEQSNVVIQSDNSTASVPGNLQVSEYDLTLAQDVGSLVPITMPVGSSISVAVPFTPVSISYDGATVKGSLASFPIIAEQANIGSFSVSGPILNITSTGRSGYSKLIGFTSAKSSTTYYQIQFTSSVSDTPILPAGAVNYPNAPIGVVGDSTGQVIPVVGGNVVLNNRVRVLSNTSILVLSFPLTGPYKFYVTLTDGTVYTYVVTFQTIDIFVPVLTKFSVLSILTSGQTPTFAEPSVTVASGYVLNPSSLGQITMTTPFNAKITINAA